MRRTNLSNSQSALEILRNRAASGSVVVYCPVVPRVHPVKRSSLRDYTEEMLRLRREGKSFEQIAEWLYAVRGTRPNRSTVMRRLRQATITQ